MLLGLPTRYPMGSEKHLVQTLTGRETPARALTADIGVVVHNVATALAVHDALRHGQPLIVARGHRHRRCNPRDRETCAC